MVYPRCHMVDFHQPHPDFVLDALEHGPVFIEYTQNDENCPPCARMRPKVHELIDEYSDKVTFFIININEHEITKYFGDEKNVKSSEVEEESFHVYDMGDIAGGRKATPTYVVVTIDKDQDEGGKIRPKFATGYGEFKENDAEKTKNELANILSFAKSMYLLNQEGYP